MYKSAGSTELHSSGLVSSHSSEWENSNWFYKYTFAVPNRMLKEGMNRELTFDDLTSQPSTDYTEPMLQTVKANWKTSKKFWFIPRLMVTLIKSFPLSLTIMLICTFIEDTIKCLNPVLLLLFLRIIGDETASSSTKYLHATFIAISSVCFILIHHVLFFRSMRTGWNWRTVSQGLVFDHLLSLDPKGLEKSSKGNMVNLISNDVSKFEGFVVFMCFFLSAPCALLGVLYLLTQVLDFPSALCGLSLVLIFLPLQVWMGGKFAKLRTKTAARTDARIRHIAESIEGIATVKSYGWETPFFTLIRKLRAAEVETISASQKLKSIVKALDYCIVPTCNLFMQYVYWLRGGVLTVPVAFSCLLFLQVLRSTIFVHWAQSVEQGSEAIASCYRLEAFLSLSGTTPQSVDVDGNESKQQQRQQQQETADVLQEFDTGEEEEEGVSLVNIVSHTTTLPPVPHMSASRSILSDSKNVPLFRMDNASFCYGTEAGVQPVLSGLNLEVQKNELVMVVGPVGSGKSSFLGALLGELNLMSADGNHLPANVYCGALERPRIAYCAQLPWIFSASVKQNVVFGGDASDLSVVNEVLYESAMRCCCILDDLKQLPNGHDTDIGEKGVSISGGQKARLSLARAVYSNADVYLLDDPLSAVDAHVSRTLFDDCILKVLKARGKSIILCTHQMQYLQYADKVLVLNDDGSQQYFGTFTGLQKSKSKVNLLEHIEEEQKQRQGSIDSTGTGASRGRSVSELAADSILDVETAAVSDSEMDAPPPVELISMIEIEQKATGDIKGSVYVQWLRAGGMYRGLFCFFLIAFSQAVLMIHEYWLRWWVADEFHLKDYQYLMAMGIMTPIVFTIGFFRVRLFFEFCLKSASEMHQKSLWAILHSPLSFFTANPSGRILNRFSKDQSEMDERLPLLVFDCSYCITICLGAVCLISISIPMLMLAFPPLIFIFMLLRRKYMCSMREIKRLEANTRSPIYAGFSATLDGLSTLRAYKLQSKMRNLFKNYLDQNGRAWWSYLMAARWFGYRMDVLAMIVLVLTTYLAAFYSDKVDQGLLGFALVYSMNLAGLFQWTVRLTAEVETMMTAVERISQYSLLPSESGYRESLESVLRTLNNSSSYNGEGETAIAKKESEKEQKQEQETGGWVAPTYQEGLGLTLDIRNLVVRYRHDLAPILNGLCMNVPAGSKVGIVGRTGSGKSTVLSALLRLNIVDECGSIMYGEIDLLHACLEEARGLVTIIPQQPHLFLGTLRFNLDPFNRYTDANVWKALEDASIADFVHGNKEGLLMRVEESGNNLSVGQKQLLSLARAILRQNKVILMDEVTASVDYETDATIQKTIRTAPSLRDATIITVAHRLQTISDSDRIFVINAGILVEEGTPIALLNNTSSYFHALVNKSGEMDAIKEIASSHSSAVNLATI